MKQQITQKTSRVGLLSADEETPWKRRRTLDDGQKSHRHLKSTRTRWWTCLGALYSPTWHKPRDCPQEPSGTRLHDSERKSHMAGQGLRDLRYNLSM